MLVKLLLPSCKIEDSCLDHSACRRFLKSPTVDESRLEILLMPLCKGLMLFLAGPVLLPLLQAPGLWLLCPCLQLSLLIASLHLEADLAIMILFNLLNH